MDTPEDQLAVARRLLGEAWRLVEAQRIIVHRRQLAGLDTELSEELSEDVLRTFEQSLPSLKAIWRGQVTVGHHQLPGR
jgi:hypothetical protein